jgi:hypothetical protein
MSILVIFIVIGIIVNSIIAHLVGINGSKREIGYWTSFLVSFFTTPIIGLLLVLTSKVVPNDNNQNIDTKLSEDNIQLSIHNKVKPINQILAILVFMLILFLLYYPTI